MEADINIIPYQKKHHRIFRELNLEWLEHYHLTESHDLLVLDDPDGTILQRGGFIWLAESGNEIIGSAALIRESDEVYELAKMAVAPSHRGRGVSKLLIETCLEKAREIGAAKLMLFSNHQLKTAISLYEKYGFRHIAVHDSPFETADVRMELIL